MNSPYRLKLSALPDPKSGPVFSGIVTTSGKRDFAVGGRLVDECLYVTLFDRDRFLYEHPAILSNAQAAISEDKIVQYYKMEGYAVRLHLWDEQLAEEIPIGDDSELELGWIEPAKSQVKTFEANRFTTFKKVFLASLIFQIFFYVAIALALPRS